MFLHLCGALSKTRVRMESGVLCLNIEWGRSVCVSLRGGVRHQRNDAEHRKSMQEFEKLSSSRSEE